MNTPKSPVALFVFKRPEKTRQILEHIAADELASQVPLVVFSEGPRNEQEAKLVAEVRGIVKSRKWVPNIEVVERAENWGLFRSLSTGVGQMCERFGEVIVLEDDLQLSSSFFPFMFLAMNKYRDEPRVFQVTGYSYPVELSGAEDAFFISHSSCWGWGTWQRAWKSFQPNAESALKIIESSAHKRKLFNMDGGYDYRALLRMQAAGKISSWGILWHASIFLEDALILMPRKSLVANRGDDAMGTHYGAGGYADHLHELTNPRFPNSVKQDHKAHETIAKFLKHNSSLGSGTVIKKVKRLLKNLLSY